MRRRRAVEDLSLDERRAGGVLPNSWHVPSNTEYYATVTSPRRYHERLPEAGIDFAVLYPSFGNALLQIHEEEQRVTLCRLYNEYVPQLYRPYQDRFTVASLVPMHTPDEAVAGLEHIKALGAKVALIPSHVHRPVPGQTWPPDDEWADIRIPQWETYGWLDASRDRQSVRLRPGMGEDNRIAASYGCRIRQESATAIARVHLEFRLQPDRALRCRGQRIGKVVVSRRRDIEVPRISARSAGGWRGHRSAEST